MLTRGIRGRFVTLAPSPQVLDVPVRQLRENPDNPRRITPARLEDLKRSIQDDPDLIRARPLIALPSGVVLCGNMRFRAVKALGWKTVPTIVAKLSRKRARMWMLRDNNEWGDWNGNMVAELLADMAASGQDLSLTGFDGGELKTMALIAEGLAGSAVEEIPPLPAEPTSRRGDVWTVGPHRLMCGDSSDRKDVERLLDGGAVDFLFASPPYNVGKAYRSYDDATKDREAYLNLIRPCLAPWIAALTDGRVIGWNVGASPRIHWARHYTMLEDEFHLQHVRTLIWRKQGIPVLSWQTTRGKAAVRRFTPNHVFEFVMLFAKGEVQLGGSTEFAEVLRDDVFTVNQAKANLGVPDDPSVPLFRAPGQSRRRPMHPAAFPVALPQAFIAHFADKGAVVGDPFGGVGSTVLAAHLEGRVGMAMDIEPRYVDVAVQRLEALTGEKAQRDKR